MTVQKQAALQLQLNREELAHLARVAVMGEMAVSLAHELTQPLTAIMSNADVGERLLRRQPTDLDEFRNILADIKRDVRRAGDVIHGIRRMAKKGKTVREFPRSERHRQAGAAYGEPGGVVPLLWPESRVGA